MKAFPLDSIIQLSPELRTALFQIQTLYSLLGSTMNILDTFIDHPDDHPGASSGDVASINMPQNNNDKVIDFIGVILGSEYKVVTNDNHIVVTYEPKNPLRKPSP